MGLMDILKQYTNAAPASNADIAHDHYDEVAHGAPPEILGPGSR